jgi:hypothetical protein
VESALEVAICEAIVAYHATHPDLMVSEIMSALNAIYRDLDRLLRKHGDTAQVIQMKRKEV